MKKPSAPKRKMRRASRSSSWKSQKLVTMSFGVRMTRTKSVRYIQYIVLGYEGRITLQGKVLQIFLEFRSHFRMLETVVDSRAQEVELVPGIEPFSREHAPVERLPLLEHDFESVRQTDLS